MSNGNANKHLIVAGIPRSGSTSLYTYFSYHPEICASSIKETQYFLPSLNGKSIPPLSTYHSFFSTCNQKQYLMEASPSYFFGGANAAKAIYETLNNKVKLLFILRDPIERLISCYYYDIMVGAIEKEINFEDFLKSAELRSWRSVESGFYIKYLEGWFQYFSDAIKILFYDDLKDDPLAMMDDICTWLSLSPEVYHSRKFTRENRKVIYKNKRLHMFARAINTRYEIYFRHHPRFKRGIRRLYFLFNESSKKNSNDSVISHETRTNLEQFYEPYNRDLYTFLASHGQKISGWLSNFAP